MDFSFTKEQQEYVEKARAFSLRIPIEKHLFAAIFAVQGLAAEKGMLAAGHITPVVGIGRIGARVARIVFLDPPFHLLEEPLG